MKENRNEQIEEIKSALDIDNKVIQPISFVDYNKYTDNDVQMTYAQQKIFLRSMMERRSFYHREIVAVVKKEK